MNDSIMATVLAARQTGNPSPAVAAFAAHGWPEAEALRVINHPGRPFSGATKRLTLRLLHGAVNEMLEHIAAGRTPPLELLLRLDGLPHHARHLAR